MLGKVYAILLLLLLLVARPLLINLKELETGEAISPADSEGIRKLLLNPDDSQVLAADATDTS